MAQDRVVYSFARRPALVLWGLFVLTIPFYFTQSGLPQPGNILLIPMIPLTFSGWHGRLPRATSRTLRALRWFTVWVCVINFGWALALNKWDIQYTVFPFYYIFNLLIFFCGLVLHARYREAFLRVTVYAVYINVMVQVVAGLFFMHSDYRASLFFNNPNQLGYYSLLAGTVIAVAHRRVGIGVLGASAGIMACAYLGLVSASRAAVAGLAIQMCLLVFANPRVIIVTSIAAGALFMLGGPISDAIEQSHERIVQDRYPQITFAEERGYDRLWNYRAYVLIGAGEGDLERFAQEGKTAHEIHSSIATVVFSYGIIGTILFLLFAGRMVSGSGWRASSLLLPALSYTIAHQGLRFTMLWVLAAVFVCLKASNAPPKPRLPRAASI